MRNLKPWMAMAAAVMAAAQFRDSMRPAFNLQPVNYQTGEERDRRISEAKGKRARKAARNLALAAAGGMR